MGAKSKSTLCAGVAINEVVTEKWSISQFQMVGDRPVGPMKYKVSKLIIATGQSVERSFKFDEAFGHG
jgi:hypothetical protein